VKTETPAVARLSGTVGDSQWYKQQAKSRYTLQVLGTRSESTALAFVRENRNQYHYFRKIHQGQPLFVVTYSSFADRAAAQAAISDLPGRIQKDKPWPRTFLSIQQELR
jgi:DamX protein